MDPRTGAILAMADWPQINPNDAPRRSAESLQKER